jgi:hypothetical protein
VTRTRLAQVRFYVDADVLGLAHVLASLRSDVTFPGDAGATIKRRRRPRCVVITPEAKDDEWIPVVASAGWLVITRDRHIEEHRREVALVIQHRARLVTLSGKDAKGTWQQLEIVMRQWRQIENAANKPGPFIFRATATRFTPVPLRYKRGPRRPLRRRPSPSTSTPAELPLDF